jgi:hypothetical protein
LAGGANAMTENRPMSSAAASDFMVADLTPAAPTVAIVEANADEEPTLWP